MLLNKNTNPFNEQDRFNQKMNNLKDEAKKNTDIIKFKKQTATIYNSDPTNKDSMKSRSINVLQERYQNGQISLDEFNKKCNEINKNCK